MTEPDRAQPGARDPDPEVIDRRVRRRGAQHALAAQRALAHDLDERPRLAGAGRAPDQRDVAAAQRAIDRGALAFVEGVVERRPRRRRERPRRPCERRDFAQSREIRVRECRARLRDRRIAAIERQLGVLRIERVVTLDDFERAVEHQPHALLFAALEHAAHCGRLVGTLGPQPDRLARREPQVIEIDRVGHAHPHAHALARRRLFVDHPQMFERDAECDALDQRATAALELELRARGHPLAAPRGG